MHTVADDAVIAVHEAGHAVIAVWLGVPVVSVDIVPSPDDGTAGHTVCTALPAYVRQWHDAGSPRPVPQDVRKRLEHEVMIHLAGDMAQSKATGGGHSVTVNESRFGSVVVGWEWHIGDVLDAITEGRAERRTLIRRLAGLTWGLLDRDVAWATVCAVAAELAEHRHLSGRRVREIATSVTARAWAAEGARA
jgi:hypothetical protein